MVNTRLGEVKVVGKAASRESVRHSGSWDVAVQVITKRNREKKILSLQLEDINLIETLD